MSQHTFKKYLYTNERGQAIVLAIFIMVIALAAGMTISTRFISTLRNDAEVDDSSKALSLAEAAVEKILLLPSDTLNDFIDNGTCGDTCHLQITANSGQILRADVTLSHTGETIDAPYPLDLTENQTVEVFLEGYTSGQNVYVCWNTDASLEAQYLYRQSNTVASRAFAANASSSSHTENGFSNTAALFGYNSCITIPATNTPLALRLKPYYRPTEVFVVPAPGYGLPIQGIQIVAVGSAGNARRKVTVVKTNSYVPTQFDYVLYQKSSSQPLSN